MCDEIPQREFDLDFLMSCGEPVFRRRDYASSVIMRAVENAKTACGSSLSLLATRVGLSDGTLRQWIQASPGRAGARVLRSYDLMAVVKLFEIANMSLDREFRLGTWKIEDALHSLQKAVPENDAQAGQPQQVAELQREIRRYERIVDALLDKLEKQQAGAKE